jgi:uncharacterized protein with von Willebrand factor type A (vWA) domain
MLGDSFHAGLGATVLAEHFVGELPKMEKPNPDDLQKKIEAYQEALDQAKGAENGRKQRLQAAINQLQEKKAAAEEHWKQNKMDLQQVRIAMRNALKAAQDELDDAEEGANAFGYGTEPGKDGYNDPAQKLEMANLVRKNPKLVEIAKIAGRFRREARDKQSKKPMHGQDEITDIELGADLGRTVPAELMKLMNPLTKAEFQRKFLERSLMQYHMEAVEDVENGPIIVCIDNSGSMGGIKEIWSKGVALAMCQIAVDQKRPFAIIHFDTVVQRVDVFDTKDVDPKALIESISYFSGGGTAFDPPLKAAFEMIIRDADRRENETENFGHSDVVFITDDQAVVADYTIEVIQEAKNKTKARIYTICFGGFAANMEPLSDMIEQIDIVHDEQKTEEIKDVIFSI